MYRRRTKQLQQWASDIEDWPEVFGKYAKYFEDSIADPQVLLLNRVENFLEYHDGFHRVVVGTPIMNCLEQLFGEPAVLFKEKINYKHPGGAGFEPHQDGQAGWDAFGSHFISVLVSIDENTIENGCLQLAAGQHADGLLGDKWKPLSGERLRKLKFVPCPTKPGDAVFFDWFVPHQSALNLTDQPRRNLYLTYNRASDGDFRHQYFREKRKNFPPDIERRPGEQYIYRV